MLITIEKRTKIRIALISIIIAMGSLMAFYNVASAEVIGDYEYTYFTNDDFSNVYIDRVNINNRLGDMTSFGCTMSYNTSNLVNVYSVNWSSRNGNYWQFKNVTSTNHLFGLYATTYSYTNSGVTNQYKMHFVSKKDIPFIRLNFPSSVVFSSCTITYGSTTKTLINSHDFQEVNIPANIDFAIDFRFSGNSTYEWMSYSFASRELYIKDSNDIKLFKAGDDIITSWKLQDGMEFPYGASIEYTIVSPAGEQTVTKSGIFQGSQNSYSISYRDLVGYDDTEDYYYISYVKITWQNRYEPIKKGVLQTPFEFYIKGNKVLDDVPAGLHTTHTVFHSVSSNGNINPYYNINLPSHLGDFIDTGSGANILFIYPFRFYDSSTLDLIVEANYNTVSIDTFANGLPYDRLPLVPEEPMAYAVNKDNWQGALYSMVGDFSSYYDYIVFPPFSISGVLYSEQSQIFVTEKVLLKQINANISNGFTSLSSGISQLLMNQDLTYKLFRSEFEYLNPLIDSMNNNLNVLPVIDNKVNGIESTFNNWVVSAGSKMDAILNAINGIGSSGSSGSDGNDYSLIPDFESNLDMLNNQSLISYPLKFETDFYDALKAGYRDRFTFKFPAVSVPYRNNNMQLITEQQSAASESTFYPLDYMSSDMWTFLSSLFVFMLILGNIYFVFTAIMGGKEH